jgi:hypothetical protein
LAQLKKKKRVKADKISGRKQPRAHDILPAPDSILADNDDSRLDISNLICNNIVTPVKSSSPKLTTSTPKTPKPILLNSPKSLLKSKISKKIDIQLASTKIDKRNRLSLKKTKRKLDLDTTTLKADGPLTDSTVLDGPPDQAPDGPLIDITNIDLTRNSPTNKRKRDQDPLDVIQDDDSYLILNYKHLTSDIIEDCHNILKKQFPKIHGHQPTVYAPVFCDEMNRWTWSLSFEEQPAPSVQVLHNGKGHWVATIQTDNDGPIYILDSLYGPEISPSLQIQISQIYNKSKLSSIPIIVSKIQKQINSVDCGVLAIANIVEFCFNGYLGNIYLNYNMPKIREHLDSCLKLKKFSPFPKLSKSNRNKKPQIYLETCIDVYCCCLLPEVTGDMVQCDKRKCKKWYFKSCVILNNNIKKWFCSNCKRK